MQRVPDPYRVLEVGREATTAEVRAAHRRLAKRYHPDAPHADAERFLAVQDAYELLRDPLRRRDWDGRHAPGPVRAEPAAGQRRRGKPAAAGPTAADASDSPRIRRRREGVDATFGPNDRPPDADLWTWTAEGVPWWEDGGTPRTRRAPRRRSSTDVGGAPSAEAGDGRSTSGAAGASRSGRAGDPRTPRHRASAPSEPAGPEARSEFDVFSRSSGAAWSSASRAYFRRRAADMPSGAANPNTPRWTTPAGAPTPRRYDAAAPAADDRDPTQAMAGTDRPTPSAPASTAPGQGPARRPDPTASPHRPTVASRRLGAALAALLRRTDR